MTQHEKTPLEHALHIMSVSMHESRKLTPRAQAEAAHRAGGPSVDELEREIIADRAGTSVRPEPDVRDTGRWSFVEATPEKPAHYVCQV